MSALHIRFDVGAVGRARRTSQGFVVAPGRITRVGVLEYHRADGSVVRELRPPEEVFAPASMASLQYAPITDRHPAELVTPQNIKALQVGMATTVRKDGDIFLGSDLIVQDGAMIAKVEAREVSELSAGYQVASIERLPGEWNGERYEQIQRGITYNHIGLGPKGWGRAGSDVALRMDSNDSIDSLQVERLDDALATLLALHPEAVLPLKFDGAEQADRKEEHPMIKIRIDGIDYEVSETAAPHISKHIEVLSAKLAEAISRADSAEGKLDATTKELADAATKLDAATKPETIAAAVAARVALEHSARKVLGDAVKFDGLTDRDIRVTVLRAKDEKFDAQERSDSYIDGRFDAVIESAPERRDSRDVTRRAIVAGGGTMLPQHGAKTEVRIDSAESARRANRRAAISQGREPLPSATKSSN